MKMQSKKAQMILDTKLKKLYETIKDYKDPKTNRQVATIFMKLPSKMVSCISNNDDCPSIKRENYVVLSCPNSAIKYLILFKIYHHNHILTHLSKTFCDSNQLTFFFISFRHFLFVYLFT